MDNLWIIVESGILRAYFIKIKAINRLVL